MLRLRLDLFWSTSRLSSEGASELASIVDNKKQTKVVRELAAARLVKDCRFSNNLRHIINHVEALRNLYEEFVSAPDDLDETVINWEEVAGHYFDMEPQEMFAELLYRKVKLSQLRAEKSRLENKISEMLAPSAKRGDDDISPRTE